MFRSKSEKLLSCGLAGILLFALGRSLVVNHVIGPIASKRARIFKLAANQDATLLDLRRFDAAKNELSEIRSAHLPTDSGRATVIYRERLFKLTRASGIRDASISPLQSQGLADIGRRVTFSIQAESNAKALARLVDLLENDSIDNRITMISVDRLNQQKLRLNVHVEIVAVKGANSQASDKPLADQEQDSPLVTALVSNDPFLRGYNGPPRSVATSTNFQARPQETLVVLPKPKIDPRNSIRLIALVDFGGETIAWMHDSRLNQEMQYRVNDTISFPGWQARVITCDAHAIVLEIDGQRQTLDLGSLLSDTKQLAS